MTEFEKAEKLREKADVSYWEAKDALEHSGGDLLEALIYLEKQGKAKAPPGGGYFSGSVTHNAEYQPPPGSGGEGGSGAHSSGESFSDMMKRFGEFCVSLFHKGNSNYLEATKDGEPMFSCPVTVLVILLLFFFWFTLPLYVISLFFGIRYRFIGEDLGRESVNRVMDSANDIVEDVKKTFAENVDSKGS